MESRSRGELDVVENTDNTDWMDLRIMWSQFSTTVNPNMKIHGRNFRP
jgi:hypothetical protein